MNDSINVKPKNVHEDANGLVVISLLEDMNGTAVEGNKYIALHGSTNQMINFQKGWSEVEGPNGLTNEAMLDIVIHRTKILNAQCPSEENLVAIEHMEAAQAAYNRRMSKRIADGTAGTNQV